MLLKFIARVLTVLFGIVAPGSVSAQSGEQVINGTRVFTVIDQGRGVATFSNDCGSQTLTQQDLQRGAIPNRIIPCPRGGDHDAARDREFKKLLDATSGIFSDSGAEGDVNYVKALRHEADKEYLKASMAFDSAKLHFSRAKDAHKEALALAGYKRNSCKRSIEGTAAFFAQDKARLRNWVGGDDAAVRSKHIESLETEARGWSCKDFPELVSFIEARILSLQRMDATSTPSPMVTASPPGTSSGSSRWLPPGSQAQPGLKEEKRVATPDIHMGNKPVTGVGTGAPTYGLTSKVRRELDQVRGDQARRKAYLDTLSADERRKAEAYLDDRRPPTAVPVVKTSSECAYILQRLRPRAPNQEWIEWHMERAGCRPDGTPK